MLEFLERNRFRTVPDNDLGRICTALKCGESEVPDVVMDSYWRIKEICDRLSIHEIPDSMIVTVIVSTETIHAPPDRKSVIDLFLEGNLIQMDWVEVRYRGNWVPGQIIEVDKNRKEVVVVMEGANASKRLKEHAVRASQKQQDIHSQAEESENPVPA